MLSIRVMSDIHNEFGLFKIPKMENDDKSILVLAGDIDVDTHVRVEYDLLPFLMDASKQFKAVIYILGNHEYYHGSLATTPLKIKDTLKKVYPKINNVHVLDNEHVTIDDVLFIGSTLWTDFNKADPQTMYAAGRGMNDFRLIQLDKTGEIFKLASPADILRVHYNSKKYVFDTVVAEKSKHRKVVLVVHHAPTYKSIPARFKGDSLNGAFASDLSNEILDTKPDLIIHGHIHDNYDYMVGDTRIVCNPRGYEGHELNPDFIPTLRLEI